MYEERKRRYDPNDSRVKERPFSRSESYRRINDDWTRSKREPISFRDTESRHGLNNHGSERSSMKSRIDRTKTTPMLIRVFCNIGRHHKASDYANDKFPDNEVRIYTWKDATLRELMGLVTEAFPIARTVGTCFDFSIVYPNFRLRTYEMKEVGSTCSGQERVADTITLDSTKFHVGDCLDVAIFPPKNRGSQL